jgi:nitrite reductase/ring-hydroxylating ferredoxin subunit
MFVDVAGTDELPVGRAMTRVVGDRRIALYHTETGFFATGNTCPHRGGPLGEGDLLGNDIVCPWHFWAFDVRTGECPGNPEVRVESFEVRVESGRVLVHQP